VGGKRRHWPTPPRLTDLRGWKRSHGSPKRTSLRYVFGKVHGGRPVVGLHIQQLRTLSATDVSLALHGAFVIPEDVRRCIDVGIAKWNLNIELRRDLLQTLESQLADARGKVDVTSLVDAAIRSQQRTVGELLERTAGMASGYPATNGAGA
jgi:fructose/tagatose bisphosphate aldolase